MLHIGKVFTCFPSTSHDSLRASASFNSQRAILRNARFWAGARSSPVNATILMDGYDDIGGFTPLDFQPINGLKRPLTPTAATQTQIPTKRLAVIFTPKPTAASHDYNACQYLPQSSFALVADSDECDNVPGLVRTPPSPAVEEIPESPTFPPQPIPQYASEPASGDLSLSWMNEFVDLDGADMGFVLADEDPSDSHSAESQSLSNSQADRLLIEAEQALVKEENTAEEDYGLIDSDDEELVQLIAKADERNSIVPPSNATKNIHCDSGPMSNLDSQLQHRPLADKCQADLGEGFAEPDLLDETVDWDLVTACEARAAISGKVKSSTEGALSSSQKVWSGPNLFVRPPFPAKMRDRSVIVGFSSTVMMRTCFRVGELLNAHTKSAQDNQDVVLELFARVSYSERGSFSRIQHFQLQDLFADRQPCVFGVFKDWKNGGLDDEQSRVFLGQGGKNRLCRCICKLTDDKKAVNGLVAQILRIRETTWDEVQWALRIVTRDVTSKDDDDSQDEMKSSTEAGWCRRER